MAAPPGLASAVYHGAVRHRRHSPVAHGFEYRHTMLYLDLDELPAAFDVHPLYSARRPALARFRRADHLGPPDRPLADCVRDLVAEHGGHRPDGPVRLLTTLRQFGHAFNPVSFHYCFDRAGERVEAVVAHVTNTPWGESHAYVLERSGAGTVLADRIDKAFHVSPFIGMDHRYDWRVSEPGERIAVHIDELDDDGATIFDATLSLRRSALTRRELSRALARFPLTSLRVLSLIYVNALALKLRGAPYHPHPGGRRR
ncbi:MAG: DUF1365 domain-containing protein [Solirubrobacterales bacterium]|nr:DUF1365 domain-containing protein [Solirubrobacterales bacterium]